MIIGAGVSGLVAAQKAAKDGLDTILIEKRSSVGFPYRKIDITEDVGINDIVSELKLRIFDKSKKSKWLSANGSFLLNSKIVDLFIKRSKDEDSFEKAALDHSLDFGCRVFTGVNNIDLRYGSNGIEGVDSKIGGRSIKIKPSVVIGADGSKSNVLASSPLRKRKKHNIYLEGFGITAENLDIPSGLTHIFFDEYILPGGYFFMSKSSKGLGVASVAMNYSKPKGIGVDTYFWDFVTYNKYVRDVFRKSSNKKYFVGGCESFELDRRSYKNVLLVGNAAGLLDPLFGYGVNQAIYSGYWAARTIKENISEGCEKVCEEYEMGLGRSLLPDIKSGMKMRLVFDSLKNRHFDRLMNMLNHISEEIEDMDDFLNNPVKYPIPLAKSLIRQPRLLGLMRYMVRMF
ncbi:MAG: NAD(P)/FAD-dependent oxidoreductase [Candidatus Micrarchaeota archaeon]|nr:NAD(P)/FAD-dependent oxidoreductase [Candidatus Micrarchaeota archaeon]